jgi:hypothetical protein
LFAFSTISGQDVIVVIFHPWALGRLWFQRDHFPPARDDIPEQLFLFIQSSFPENPFVFLLRRTGLSGRESSNLSLFVVNFIPFVRF